MFFFWGPFVFIFPLLIIFLLLRVFTGFLQPPRRDHLDHESDPYSVDYEGREDEREHEARNLQVRIYKLAYKLEGRITVSDIVVETGLDAKEAEETIQAMVDNQRVRMEVQEDGVVVYEFPELLSRFKKK